MFDAAEIPGQATGLKRRAGKRPVQVIAVASGKGGVGKTNITANLAVQLSRAGNEVLVMDADLGMANMDILLGMSPKKNLYHVLNGDASINEIVVKGPDNINVIPASSGIRKMTNLSYAEHVGMIRAFSELNIDPDYLLIDSSAGITENVMTLSRASHQVLVVICDEPTSVADAYGLIKVLNKDQGIHNFSIVCNMVPNNIEGMNLYKRLNKVTERFLDITLDYFGSVPYDEYLKKSVQNQVAVSARYPRSKASLAIGKMARKIESLPVQSSARGHIEFFLERLFDNQTGRL